MKALAAAWARADNELASLMLSFRGSWGLVDVLKAISLLDAGRKIRCFEKDLKRLQMSQAKLSAKVLGKYKSNIDNLTALKPSVSFTRCSSLNTQTTRHRRKLRACNLHEFHWSHRVLRTHG